MLIAREPMVQKKLQFRIRMNTKIHDELMQYCQWAGISYRDFFIEQACEYILTNDTEWINYKRSQLALNNLTLSKDHAEVQPFSEEN